jgi:hypothetical protein
VRRHYDTLIPQCRCVAEFGTLRAPCGEELVDCEGVMAMVAVRRCQEFRGMQASKHGAFLFHLCSISVLFLRCRSVSDRWIQYL